MLVFKKYFLYIDLYIIYIIYKHKCYFFLTYTYTRLTALVYLLKDILNGIFAF